MCCAGVRRGGARCRAGHPPRRTTPLLLAIIAVLHAVPPAGSAAQRTAAAPGAADATVEWATVPAGRFLMGCVPGDRNCRGNEHHRHEVELSRGFELTATEVTIGQFDAFARSAGGRTPRQPLWNDTPRHPVVNVTWQEAAAMCGWLGGRLPTEAEWERAARGGEDGRIFWWGDTFDRRSVNAGGSGAGDRWRTTAPVGSFPPNAYGLYDMAGNVWEWTADWYARQYPKRPALDPAGPRSGTHRVIRGGSWDSSAARVRTSSRYGLPAGARYNLYVGFRCAR